MRGRPRISQDDGVLNKPVRRPKETEMATVTTLHPVRRELARRANDGIEVTLFWNAREDTLTVEVHDGKTDKTFELEAPRDRALDVYYHPYAYAAHLDVEYADVLGEAA
jgi:hypothetical protein